MRYDSCGVTYGPNYDTCCVYIKVVDVEPPLAKCVDSTCVILDPNCEGKLTVADVDAGSDDNCNVDSMWLYTEDGRSGENIYFGEADANKQVGVCLVVMDINGNTDTCCTTTWVKDVTPPVVTCPADAPYSYSTSATTCDTTATWPHATAVDACDDLMTLTYVLSGATVGGPFNALTGPNPVSHTVNLGATKVTYTATDSSGNSNTCDFFIFVDDNTAPTMPTLN